MIVIDSRDLNILFDNYSNMVYRIALSFLKNTQDAEDVVQVVFMKLIDGKVKIIPGKERALITQITVNYCKDILRSFWKKRTEELNDNFLFEDQSDIELFNVIMSLPNKYRIVVYLHYYEGYTFSEISALLNISPSAVSMRLHRAIKLLHSELGGNIDEI